MATPTSGLSPRKCALYFIDAHYISQTYGDWPASIAWMVDDELRSEVLHALGNNLRAARLKSGLTQERLALEANISLRMVNKIERGRANPSVLTLTRLARKLGIPTSELLLDTSDS